MHLQGKEYKKEVMEKKSLTLMNLANTSVLVHVFFSFSRLLSIQDFLWCFTETADHAVFQDSI